MQTIATATSKFILSGEHFVVDGMPSVVIPASCFSTQITLTERNDNEIKVNCIFDCEQPDIERNKRAYEADVLKLFERAAHFLDISLKGEGLSIEVKSQIPPGQGAGSSSALCKAVVEVLFKHYLVNDVHPNYLQWFGTALENEWHGPVSGIDNAAISWRRMMLYQKYKPIEFIVPGGPMFFVVGSVGKRKGSSPYETFRWLREKQPLQYASYRNVMTGNATLLAKAIQLGKLWDIGAFMTESHQVFEAIGIVDPGVAEAVKVANDCGAFGTRMTGAGGGGFVIACISVQNVEKLQIAWQKLGLKNIRVLQFGI